MSAKVEVKRRWTDTHMPTAGAEHYVVAQLMFRQIEAFKCERGRAGIDIVAADAKRKTSVGIQVKARHTKTATGFPITSSKAKIPDFIVFARLDLDDSGREYGEINPVCYVFPASVVRRAIEVGASGTWEKVHIKNIQNTERYREAWGLIASALKSRK